MAQPSVPGTNQAPDATGARTVVVGPGLSGWTATAGLARVGREVGALKRRDSPGGVKTGPQLLFRPGLLTNPYRRRATPAGTGAPGAHAARAASNDLKGV